MALQSTLQTLPEGSQVLSPRLAVIVKDGQLVAFNGFDAIYTCAAADRPGMRLAAGMLSSLDLAPDTALASALGMSRETVRRLRYRFEREGPEAVCRRRLGPRRPYKLTAAKQERAQSCLDQGWSVRRTAREVGLSDTALRHQIELGRLHVVPRAAVVAAAADEAAPAARSVSESTPEATPTSAGARAQADQGCEPGVGVKRQLDRGLAALGKLVEAAPAFHPAEAVPGAGVLLALPALLEQGLIEVTEGVYGRLRNGFYGLQAVLLTLAFMALLRVRTPEQLKGRAPGEMGLLLGLDRAPEVKTLRRKLEEMGQRGLAPLLQQRFAERWTAAEPEHLGVLYVDGHVRIYHGRKHTLPKLHVQKRGRPMPGTQDFYVNDARAEPLFVVTAPATEGLLTMIEDHLLPEIRNLVADPVRRITVVFDREGWSPAAFLRFAELGFDVLTYRKGKQSTWQRRFFHEVCEMVDGRQVVYQLAERRVRLSNGLRVREIRRLCDNGHQTAVITTHQTLSTFEVAQRMFSRWRQENFFRYMQQQFDLDHMCTQAVEPGPAERLVPHPERARLEAQMKTEQQALDRVVGRRVHLKPGAKMRVQHRTLTEDEVDAWIQAREAQLRDLRERRDALPKKVPQHEVLDRQQIVQLERERKTLTDLIKMTAYRAESQLARCLAPVFKRHEDEARSFLQAAFQATADLLPDASRGTLTVRFHGLSTPRATRALAALCQIANAQTIHYPGTDLRLHFEAPQAAECHTRKTA